jgi:hypothetical protein
MPERGGHQCLITRTFRPLQARTGVGRGGGNIAKDPAADAEEPEDLRATCVVGAHFGKRLLTNSGPRRNIYSAHRCEPVENVRALGRGAAGARLGCV